MKAEFVRFLLPLAVLLPCAVLEEAVPHVLSLGFPFLAMAALLLGFARSQTEAILLAVLAGSLEDALSGLPLTTTSSFLVLVSLGARFAPVPWPLAILAYPIYQLWLVVWTDLPAGALWSRLLVSVPLSALTVCALYPVLRTIERRLSADAR